MSKKYRLSFTADQIEALHDRVAAGWENADEGEPKLFWDTLMRKVDDALRQVKADESGTDKHRMPNINWSKEVSS